MRQDASDDGGDAEANDNQPLGLGSCELRGELALAFTMAWEMMGTRKGAQRLLMMMMSFHTAPSLSKNDEIQGVKLEKIIFFKCENVAMSGVLFYPA